MTKTISKVGNSQGLIFDAALMDLAGLKVGDELTVTVVPETGSIVLQPLRRPTKKEISSLIKKTASDYRKTLRKLA